jgi:hypothetical protein
MRRTDNDRWRNSLEGLGAVLTMGLTAAIIAAIATGAAALVISG